MKTHTLTYEDDKIETSTVRASRLDREADLAAWKAPPGKETEAAERVLDEIPARAPAAPTANARCPRCRGRAYVGLLSVECVEAMCKEWREPAPTVERVMVPTALGHCEVAYRAFGPGAPPATHPVREEAIRLWKAGAR